jgi:hypothetical protein
MNSYQKEQAEALFMVRTHLASLTAPETNELRRKIADYLAFRHRVDGFLHDHFSDICTQKCYRSNVSACCARESIVTFFGDVVVNVLAAQDHEIEALFVVLERPNHGFKCVYLGDRGCLWRVKPIVCEMFLCRQAKKKVFENFPRAREEWHRLQQHKQRFTWPDRPVLFDDLERYFIEAGYRSPLMYMHNSPGLIRVKRNANK